MGPLEMQAVDLCVLLHLCIWWYNNSGLAGSTRPPRMSQFTIYSVCFLHTDVRQLDKKLLIKTRRVVGLGSRWLRPEDPAVVSPSCHPPSPPPPCSGCEGRHQQREVCQELTASFCGLPARQAGGEEQRCVRWWEN